jgi:hypothetical protein
VTELSAYIFAGFVGGLLAVLILVPLHLRLWEWRPVLPLVARYAIGVACLNVGIGVAGAILENAALIFVPWVVAGMAGVAVGALHLWRYQQDAHRAINLIRRAIGQRGAGDAAWEAREPDDRRT